MLIIQMHSKSIIKGSIYGEIVLKIIYYILSKGYIYIYSLSLREQWLVSQACDTHTGIGT